MGAGARKSIASRAVNARRPTMRFTVPISSSISTATMPPCTRPGGPWNIGSTWTEATTAPSPSRRIVHADRPRVEAATAGREGIELDCVADGDGEGLPGHGGRQVAERGHVLALVATRSRLDLGREGVGDAGDVAERVIGDVATGHGAVQPSQRAGRLLER